MAAGGVNTPLCRRPPPTVTGLRLPAWVWRVGRSCGCHISLPSVPTGGRSGGQTVEPGPHRTRQRCAGPVCDRPSASRPVPPRRNRLQRRLEAVLTGRNGPGRARTAAYRAGTALTGAVRTGPHRADCASRLRQRHRNALGTGRKASTDAPLCLSSGYETIHQMSACFPVEDLTVPT